jgi:uncharacterized alpha/beta hydrolase family protein
MFKKILKIILFVIAILFILFLIFSFFSTKERAKLTITSNSPDKIYQLKGYKSYANTSSSNAVVVDLYNYKTNKRIQKAFYVEVHVLKLSIDWVDNTHVKINNHLLNVKELKEHNFTDYN